MEIDLLRVEFSLQSNLSNNKNELHKLDYKCPGEETRIKTLTPTMSSVIIYMHHRIDATATQFIVDMC